MRLPLVLCAGLLAAPLAHAEGTGSGFELGLRGMFQTPFGQRNAYDMSAFYTPGFALELEAGARFAGAHISLLGFVASGPVWTHQIGPEGPGGAMDTRFGAEILIRPFSSIAFQPWFGVGVGAEAIPDDWALIVTPQAGIDLRIGIFGSARTSKCPSAPISAHPPRATSTAGSPPGCACRSPPGPTETRRSQTPDLRPQPCSAALASARRCQLGCRGLFATFGRGAHIQ